MGAIIVSFTKSPQSLPFFLKVHRLLIPVKSPISIWRGQVTQGVIRFSRDSLWEFLARTLKGYPRRFSLLGRRKIYAAMGFVLLRSVILLMLFIFSACNPRSMKWLMQARTHSRTHSWGPMLFRSTHRLSGARVT